MPYVAFLIGLLGSLHCVGMCGPIAFALPVRTANPLVKLGKYLLYNFGRVVTYALLGFLIGLVGKGFNMAGLQQVLSIASGVLIICFLAIVYAPIRVTFFAKYSSLIKEKLSSVFRIYFQKTGISALFILGILNGLLPCGMVSIALLGALSTGDVWLGALFMLFFGLGTIPLMLTSTLLVHSFSSTLKSRFLKITPIFTFMVGILLIIRGLTTGDIPAKPSAACGNAASIHFTSK